jgi:hypothetical protein
MKTVNKFLLFRTVVNEHGPEDEPDEPAGTEDVEDGLPAEGVAQDAADGESYYSAHLRQKSESKLHIFTLEVLRNRKNKLDSC